MVSGTTAHSILALAALLFAVASAQPGRFYCGTTTPDQSHCDALSHSTARRGAGLVPLDSECVKAGNAGYFCGWAGARCTSDRQCDFGSCSSTNGEQGVCLGGLGDSCEGPDGPDDSFCGGNLGCQPGALPGKAVCGGEGAECSFFGTYQSGSKPNHGACQSGHCDPSSLTCAAKAARMNRVAPAVATYLDATENRQQAYRLAPAAPPAHAVTEQRQDRLAIPLGAACPVGFTVCPVARRAPQGGFLFACFDTSSSATHCGGCPELAGQALRDPSMENGVDCTTLPGVQTATCSAARCRILSCSAGYTLDEQKRSCVPKKFW